MYFWKYLSKGATRDWARVNMQTKDSCGNEIVESESGARRHKMFMAEFAHEVCQSEVMHRVGRQADLAAWAAVSHSAAEARALHEDAQEAVGALLHRLGRQVGEANQSQERQDRATDLSPQMLLRWSRRISRLLRYERAEYRLDGARPGSSMAMARLSASFPGLSADTVRAVVGSEERLLIFWEQDSDTGWWEERVQCTPSKRQQQQVQTTDLSSRMLLRWSRRISRLLRHERAECRLDRAQPGSSMAMAELVASFPGLTVDTVRAVIGSEERLFIIWDQEPNSGWWEERVECTMSQRQQRGIAHRRRRD